MLTNFSKTHPRARKKKLYRLIFKKKEQFFFVPRGPQKKMTWHFVGLLLAVILFAVANTLPPHDNLGAVGLLVLSLFGLLWTVIKSLQDNVGLRAPTDDPSDPSDPGGNDPIGIPLRFGGFSRQATLDELPWCIATSYRITYVVNGVESDPSDPTTVGPSGTETEPRFTVNRSPGVDHIEWYRAVASGSFENHTMDLQANGEYIDKLNPCDSFTPEPPTQPQTFGQFGGMWAAEAGPGFVPWCVPTVYRARYVRGTGIASDWSYPSVEFISDQYTNPGIEIVNPVPGFAIEWMVEPNMESVATGPRFVDTNKIGRAHV